MMNPDLKARWLAALRSGDYKQGPYRLETDDGRFCCLGVLCKVLGVDTFKGVTEEGDILNSVPKTRAYDSIRDAGLSDLEISALSHTNDRHFRDAAGRDIPEGDNFADSIAHIEAYL